MQANQVKRLRIRSSLGLLVLPALSMPASAQVPLQVFQNSTFSINADFGSAVTAVGDVNGDGVQDVLIASRMYGQGGSGQVRGRARVLDGTTGIVLFDLKGQSMGCGPGNTYRAEYLGWTENSLASVGDLDGDGSPDYVIGGRNHNLSCSSLGVGRAHFRSGGSGGSLHVQNGPQISGAFGWAVLGVGDQNGDGTPDVAIGAPNLDTAVGLDAGEVQIFSGAPPYSVLFTVDAPLVAASCGASVCALIDITGDGIPEFLVGMPGDDNGQLIDTGSVSIIEGGTGVTLLKVYGPSAGLKLGKETRLIGDVDNDGFPDFMTSGDLTVSEELHLFGTFGQSLAVVAPGVAGTGFGESFCGAGDTDGDGNYEIAVGAPLEDSGLGTDQGAVHLFSYAQGSLTLQRSLLGFAAGDRFGFSLNDLGVGMPGSPSIGGDWNADGLDDLLIGAPGAFEKRGAVYVMPGLCLPPKPYCSSNPNSTGLPAQIGFAGSLSVSANDFVLTANSLPPARPGLFYYGTSAFDLPFGCGRRCVGGQTTRFAPILISQAGTVNQSVDWGAEGLVPFETRFVQFWFRDSVSAQCTSGFNLTDGLVIRLCP